LAHNLEPEEKLSEAEVEQLWLEEIGRRIEAARQGKAKMYTREEAMRRLEEARARWDREIEALEHD
jgi:hypothetical protein